ncbi:MAG: hypothetical protein Q4C66_03855 [Lachnospiraceae bacterium]|nr:hypothetical protein [Lachnospiraceae bacterium]
MDKYEFNIKVEQIKKLVGKSDFQTAMKIADTIDWRRVRNANLLSMIASVYEKNEEYQEAKDILLIAFERAPIGKRLLYKLTQLALRQGNIQEAESYYREFCELAGDDSRQDILRYLILKAKGAPIEQLIHSLESYTSTELDEKWLYELADLYHQAGMEQECVKTCDKIMLMFGLGQYVDKAMELKLQYAPLTKYQMDLVENRDKYEAKLRQVEQNGVSAVAPIQEEYGDSAAEDQAAQAEAMPAKTAAEPGVVQADRAESIAMPVENTSAVQDPQAFRVAQPQPVQQAAAKKPQPASFAPVSSDPVPGRSRVEPRPIPVPAPSPEMLRSGISSQAADAAARKVQEDMVSGISASLASGTGETAGTGVTAEEKLVASVKEAEVEASLAEEMSKISMGAYTEEPVREQTRILKDVKDLKNTEALTGKTRILDDIRHIQEVKAAEEQMPTDGVGAVRAASFPHMMVEARTPEAGLSLAVDALKKAHQILDCRHPVAKITGEKLNQRGILASAAKLAGKDLIVEDAGDLSDDMLDEMNQLLAENPGEMIVILVDNPRQMKGIIKENPSLAGKFRLITSSEEAEGYLRGLADCRAAAAAASKPVVEHPMAQENYYEESSYKESICEEKQDEASALQKEPEPKTVRARNEEGLVKEAEHDIPDGDEARDEEIMGIDEFAQYCCQYASQIDCSITGKSMLALYERIEIMEEDGIALTRTAAEDLIEEAADKAEKPSLGKRITGLFSSKYDKEGLLILKEEHFI